MTNHHHTQLLDPPIDASHPGNADRVTTAMTHAAKPYFVEEAEARWYGNSLWEFLVPEQATCGQLAIFQATVPHGFSPPRHIHTREDEVFLPVTSASPPRRGRSPRPEPSPSTSPR